MPDWGRGVIYTAIRARFVEEAKVSARSVRAALPGIRIVLFTDAPPEDGSAFDEVIRLEKLSPRPHLDKLVSMSRSPFRETLFLDTDTYVCGDISGLFELLDKFDVAMTLDRRYYDAFPAGTSLPDCFCEFNQGVVAFRQSERMRSMFQASLDWADEVNARTDVVFDDQIAMRIALYFSQLRIAPLPLEYNCRFHAYGYLNGTVRILHARIPGERHTEANLRLIADKLNHETVPRVFVGGKVHILGLRRVLSHEYVFARRGPRLFWPSKAVGKALLGRLLRKVKRSLGELRARFTGTMERKAISGEGESSMAGVVPRDASGAPGTWPRGCSHDRG